LNGGDFYVYYSLDKSDQARVPRLAIRMTGSRIAEVRGRGEGQNEDSQISRTSVLEQKLKEFKNEGEKYTQRVLDRNRINDIEEKVDAGEDLSIDELVFLHEIKRQIASFGEYADPRIGELIKRRDRYKDYTTIFDDSFDLSTLSNSTEHKYRSFKIISKFYNHKELTLDDLIYLYEIEARFDENTIDPWVYEILSKRDPYEDYAYIFDVEPHKVTREKRNILTGKANVFIGDLNLDSQDNLSNMQLKAVVGALDYKPDILTGLSNLLYIQKNAFFDNVKSSKGLEKLFYVGRTIYLRNLTESKYFESLIYVGLVIDVPELSSNQILQLIKNIDNMKIPIRVNRYYTLAVLLKLVRALPFRKNKTGYPWRRAQ